MVGKCIIPYKNDVYHMFILYAIINKNTAINCYLLLQRHLELNERLLIELDELEKPVYV